MMHRQPMTKNNGYTLIEILIASLILVGVVTVGIATFLSTSGYRSKAQAIREVNQSARYALETITRDIKSANGVVDDKYWAQDTRKLAKFTGYAFLNSLENVITDGYMLPSGSKSGTSNGVIDKNDDIAIKYLVIYIKDQLDCTNTKRVMEVKYYLEGTGIFREVSFPRSLNCPIDKVQITNTNNEVTGFALSGQYPHGEDRFIEGPLPVTKWIIAPTTQPYVQIDLKIRSNGYDSLKPEERAETVMQTRVMSRLIDYK